MRVRIKTILFKNLPYRFTHGKMHHNIFMHFHDFHIGIFGSIKLIKGSIILKANNFDNNTEYKYYLEEIIPEYSSQKILYFLNIFEINDNCVFLICDSKESEYTNAVLHVVPNDESYIKFNNQKFKTGDILMKILIKLLKTFEKFSHIKTLELEDTTIKICPYPHVGAKSISHYDMKLMLIYLKMIMDGETYYSKYGFEPKKVKQDNIKTNRLVTNYQIYKYNQKLFNTNKNQMKSQDIIDVITKKIEYKYKHKILCEKINDDAELFYDKIIKSYLNKHETINTSNFIKRLVKFAFNEKYDKDKRKITWNFVHEIYVNLYKKIGYKEYNDDCLWILKL
jgi:hypothetical protein